MANGKASALLSLAGIMLLWPFALTRSISSKLQTAHSAFMTGEQDQERPHVVGRRSTQSCDSSFDNYCMNGGQCMLLVDVNERHCNCRSGFYGPRCSNLELVFKPMGEKQIVFVVFCVIMLLVGLAGALYLCCKWYKKNKCIPRQNRQGYKGVQTM